MGNGEKKKGKSACHALRGANFNRPDKAGNVHAWGPAVPVPCFQYKAAPGAMPYSDPVRDPDPSDSAGSDDFQFGPTILGSRRKTERFAGMRNFTGVRPRVYNKGLYFFTVSIRRTAGGDGLLI